MKHRLFSLLFIVIFAVSVSWYFGFFPKVNSVASIVSGRDVIKEGDLVKSVESVLSLRKEDIYFGNVNADVVVVEYYSPLCHHCAAFNAEVFPKIKREFIDTGKILFIDRPIPFSKQCLYAIKLMKCIDKGKYKAFKDSVLMAQDELFVESGYEEVLRKKGKIAGLNGKSMDRCLADEELQQDIMQLTKDAADVLGLRGTPMFFIDGEEIVGARGFDFMKDKINEKLQNKSSVG